MQKFSDDNDQYFFGFYRAKVVNNGYTDDGEEETDEKKKDPRSMGRVQVRIPGLHNDEIDDELLPWAEVGEPIVPGAFAAAGVGVSHIVPKDAWVWIFFEAGNPNFPIIFAAIRSASDLDSSTTNKVTVIQTASGHRIEISDLADDEKIKIKHKNGAFVSMFTQPKSAARAATPTISIQVTAGQVFVGGTDTVVNLGSPAGASVYPLLATRRDATMIIDGQQFQTAKNVKIG